MYDNIVSGFNAYMGDPAEEAETVPADYDYINPNAQDGEPEAPDVRTDPVEDDPDVDHEAVEED